MDIPSDEKRKIHPSEYKLPKVCQKARFYTKFAASGIFVLAFCTVAFSMQDWLGHKPLSITSLLFGVAAMVPAFCYVYLEPDLVLTDKSLIVKLPFKQYVIPWDEILEIKRETVSTWIFVSDLTLVHRLFGLIKLRLNPGFVISYGFREQYEIIKLIEYKIAIED